MKKSCFRNSRMTEQSQEDVQLGEIFFRIQLEAEGDGMKNIPEQSPLVKDNEGEKSPVRIIANMPWHFHFNDNFQKHTIVKSTSLYNFRSACS